MERAKQRFIKNLPSIIDYTNLKSTARAEDIYKLCQDAIEYNFYAVCVNPCYIRSVYEWLKERKNTDTKICSVIDFPLGQSTMPQRIHQIKTLLNYTDEFDIVMNVGILKSKNYRYLNYEFKEIREFTKGKVIKMIIETPVLETHELTTITELIADNSFDFVKTATGAIDHPNLPPTKNLRDYFNFLYLVRDVKSIKEVLVKKNSPTKIKAAKGIDSIEKCQTLVDAGASRLGMSINVLKII